MRRKLAVIPALLALVLPLLPQVARADEEFTDEQSVPTYASSDEHVAGRIVSFDGGYQLQVRDERGYLDRVQLHNGTIINPTGLTLQPGMVVSVLGENAGDFFAAEEIDTPYSLQGGYPYYSGHPWSYYGAGFALGFFFGATNWWYGGNHYYGGYGHWGYRGGGNGVWNHGYGHGYGPGGHGYGNGGYGHGTGGYSHGYGAGSSEHGYVHGGTSSSGMWAQTHAYGTTSWGNHSSVGTSTYRSMQVGGGRQSGGGNFHSFSSNGSGGFSHGISHGYTHSGGGSFSHGGESHSGGGGFHH